MQKIFFKFFLVIIIFIFAGNIALADNLQDAFKVNDGSNEDPLDNVAATAKYNTAQTDVNPIISAIIQSILSFLGVIFVILIIYGGFLWMDAKGNEQQVEKAKNTLMYAAIGLGIVVAAYAISYFVISQFSGGALEAPATNYETEVE